MDSKKNGFETFALKYQQEIEEVQSLLNKKLSDIPGQLSEELRNIESWASRVNVLLAYADSFLDLAEREFLLPKGDITELDRQVNMGASVSRHRRFRDVLGGLCRAISQRISLGQSLLRAAEREISKNAI